MRDEVKRQAPSIEIARSLLESYARETDKLKQDVKDAHAFAKQEKLSKAQLQEALASARQRSVDFHPPSTW